MLHGWQPPPISGAPSRKRSSPSWSPRSLIRRARSRRATRRGGRSDPGTSPTFGNRSEVEANHGEPMFGERVDYLLLRSMAHSRARATEEELDAEGYSSLTGDEAFTKLPDLLERFEGHLK